MQSVLLEKHIKEMHDASAALMEYSWPVVSMDDEKQIICLKERDLYVDGYGICVVLSKNDHQAHYMQTLQIYASFGAFLPFSLVCKVAERFLGSLGLYYVSIIQNDRKVYIWTVCFNKNNQSIEDKSYGAVRQDEYNGLKFHRVLNVSSSKFF
jgi:hypothetical protein